jgi:PII-like signaling protein
MAVQITMYLNESDEYQRKPLYLAVLNYLREQNVAGAGAFHAAAGFNGRMRVKTASLVEAGGKLPIVVVFVDTDDHIERVLPKLREMAAHRLIVRENVQVVEGLES